MPPANCQSGTWEKQFSGATSFSLAALAGKQTMPGSNPNGYVNAYRIRFDGVNYWLDYNYGSNGWSTDCQITTSKTFCGNGSNYRFVSMAGVTDWGNNCGYCTVFMPWQ